MSETSKAILLTAPGSAAIAVVRLIGPGVRDFLRQHFSRLVSQDRCVYGNLHDNNKLIDQAIVVLVGPDIADINIHGGPWVIKSVLDLAAANGFATTPRLEPPFPAAAIDAQDPIETEVLQYLPLARTELAVRILLAQPKAWAKLSEHSPQKILADQSLKWLLSLPRVAIIGPPNVGKSTLANQLFGQERSITADLPGTTRDWVGEVANINGLAVTLLDTPGRQSSSDPIEQAAIAASLPIAAAADLILIVLDQSVPLPETATPLLSEFPGALQIANKSDRRSAWDAAQLGAIQTTAITGHVEAVRQAILRRFQCENLTIDQPRFWTDRQRQSLMGKLI
jgi:tRNA modification GTPase